MKIHLWNAFASNNSGSYTIVGRFESEELATRVAAELDEVLTAHDTWLSATESRWQEQTKEPSPLEKFIKENGLTWREGTGLMDDWPDGYGGEDPDRPHARAIGHQVFVHQRFTITMPRAFGEFIYARGGRVETELDHAHHTVVGVFELWSQELHKQPEKKEAAVAAIVEELYADDGPLVTGADPQVLPAWKTTRGRHFGPHLRLGAAFGDLLEGFTAVERIARRHGMDSIEVKVFESWPDSDPLAFLRPCDPPLKREMFDLWLLSLGEKPEKVKEQLWQHRTLTYDEACELQGARPVVVRRRLTPAQAEELAQGFQEAGASVEVRPATGD
ncbi:hypothetical protein [Archangium lipolyticum]|uniref:hypothetical protein n=1 Tax=Archangium lipolyticum TaxID=2970465 RepID=UPI00214A2AD7|nr:hypothetical protein [Archangium lipolyticum]